MVGNMDDSMYYNLGLGSAAGAPMNTAPGATPSYMQYAQAPERLSQPAQDQVLPPEVLYSTDYWSGRAPSFSELYDSADFGQSPYVDENSPSLAEYLSRKYNYPTITNSEGQTYMEPSAKPYDYPEAPTYGELRETRSEIAYPMVLGSQYGPEVAAQESRQYYDILPEDISLPLGGMTDEEVTKHNRNAAVGLSIFKKAGIMSKPQINQMVNSSIARQLDRILGRSEDDKFDRRKKGGVDTLDPQLYRTEPQITFMDTDEITSSGEYDVTPEDEPEELNYYGYDE